MRKLLTAIMALSMILTLTTPVMAETTPKAEETLSHLPDERGMGVDVSVMTGSGRIATISDGENERFSDLDPDAWYAEAVDYALERGLMNGVGDHRFAPNDTTTRAMIVTILWSLEGRPVVDYQMKFEDVAQDSWYTEAVRWAASKGIVTGYRDTVFAPNDPITREQLAAILYSFERSKGGGFTGAWMFRLDYTDIADISQWSFEPVCWMTMKNIMSGKAGGILDPKGAATRAEATQMLMRYLLSRES